MNSGRRVGDAAAGANALVRIGGGSVSIREMAFVMRLDSGKCPGNLKGNRRNCALFDGRNRETFGKMQQLFYGYEKNRRRSRRRGSCDERCRARERARRRRGMSS